MPTASSPDLFETRPWPLCEQPAGWGCGGPFPWCVTQSPHREGEPGGVGMSPRFLLTRQSGCALTETCGDWPRVPASWRVEGRGGAAAPRGRRIGVGPGGRGKPRQASVSGTTAAEFPDVRAQGRSPCCLAWLHRPVRPQNGCGGPSQGFTPKQLLTEPGLTLGSLPVSDTVPLGTRHLFSSTRPVFSPEGEDGLPTYAGKSLNSSGPASQCPQWR